MTQSVAGDSLSVKQHQRHDYAVLIAFTPHRLTVLLLDQQ